MKSPRSAEIVMINLKDLVHQYGFPSLKRRLGYQEEHHQKNIFSIEGLNAGEANIALQILNFMKILELASIIRIIPKRLPDEILDEIDKAFKSELFKRFLNEIPSQQLIVSLFGRLYGNLSLQDKHPESTLILFQFLALTSSIQYDSDIRWLISEQRSMKSKKWEETGSYTKNFRFYMDNVRNREQADTGFQQFLERNLSYFQGLRKMLVFCQDYSILLKSASQTPLFQSALWHFHAPMIQEVSPIILSDIQEIHQWLQEEENNKEQLDSEMLKEMASASKTLSNLRDSNYKTPMLKSTKLITDNGFSFTQLTIPNYHPNKFPLPRRATGRRTMTKSKILDHLSKKLELSKKKVNETLEELVALAYKEAKNAFTLPGLGKLVVVNRKARMNRNPLTGVADKAPISRILKFRVAKVATDAVLGKKKK